MFMLFLIFLRNMIIKDLTQYVVTVNLHLANLFLFVIICCTSAAKRDFVISGYLRN